MSSAQVLPTSSASSPLAPPRRHGADLQVSRQMAARLKLLISGPCEPDHATWARMGSALWQGDPLADEVGQWLHQAGMSAARGRLQQAIEHGVVDGDDAPPALRRLIEHVQTLPDWVNPELMAQGARVMQSTGLHGMRVLRDAGLMAGYQASAINQTLVQTGALNRGAQRRVAETTSWWLDCTADGGMLPHAPGWKATLHVRVMHALVRQSVRQRPTWDAATFGLPINQIDMQATYLAFSVVQLLALRTTGFLVTASDARAVMHLWRYIGWLMGVDEAWLCDDEMQGRISLYRNLISQAPPDETSVALGRALMDEPLHRHYAWGAAWRGRFDKARHLSLVHWFVGRKGMRHLGLPATLPWYPLLTWLPLLIGSSLPRLLPGAVSRRAIHGRTVQNAYWRQEMGGGEVRGHCPRL
ncbi:oxygenase MpaB family protein [Aquabacterium sp.]|uniref:oxygenase MpaB family protein n=1 Tax=Aquabacterium sp. TaxID=1872578 RepID=UPI002487F1C5|nr:oxygenase MpaB family protein [Aquabacterium sp.]MDI1258029.1 oxygenase MpaB family protein [Aquabacterium sp.]